MNVRRIRKNTLLTIASLALTVSFFTGCPSGAPEAGEGGGDTGGPAEVSDEAKVKEAENEAMEAIKTNHEMRKEIFESKNELGIPTD